MPFDLSSVISQDDASLSSDVVACIHRRFRHGAWTTRAGPDIISVNPVGAVIDKTAAVAIGQDDEGDLSVKAASGEWARVCRRRAKAKEGEGEEEEDKVVVVVTGVSGSGKSATVRRCLEHVADPSSEFMSKLGPIDVVLSALGHAATPANEDSSRFGKLIMIHPSGRCKLETYLLERGRVTYQNPNEGGFHIMACLASLASPLLPPDSHDRLSHGHVWSEKAWCRTLASVIEKGNGSLVYLSDVTRLDSIQKTTERVDAFHHALQDLGWTSHDIDTLFNWLCGILVLGNDPHAAARLWQISEADLDRVIMTMAAGVTRSVVRQAEATAGIARMMYVALWDNVVERINTALGGTEAESSESGGWIAFLDLFGPENFELNSFEQYCINWTNETLHESLVSNFIKFLEQTYAGQGLSLDLSAADTCASSHVDANTRADAPTRSRDNCLRALDGKTDSINCVLQDVTVLPAAGGVDLDNTLADRLRKVFPPAHKWRPNAAAVEMSSAPAKLLTIHHEIQTCVYDLTGWISKNAETIDQRFIRLWDKQGAAMIAEAVRRPTSMTNGSGSGNRTSIILQQRRSLARLGKTLEGARLLHIACVRRDNARARSGPDQGWDTIHLRDQLVGCGLVASLKIARRYPTIPMSLTESREAYGPLLGDDQELDVWMASLCDNMAGDKFISGTDRVLLSAGFKAKLDRLREAYLLEERRRQAAKQAERDKEAERKKEEDNDKAQRLDERHAEKAAEQGAEEAAERVAEAMLSHHWDDDGAGDVTMLDLNMSMLDESVDMSIEDLEPPRQGVSVQAQRTLTPSRSDAECILYALTYFVAHAPDHLFRGIDIGAIFKSRTARALCTGVIGSSIVGGKGSEGMMDDLVGALLGRMVITSPQASDMTSTLVNHFRPALELWSQAAMVASISISTASAISAAIPDVDTNAGADALVKALCETIVPALMAATTHKVDEMYGRRVSSTDAEHRDEDEALRTELGEALIVHLSDLYALFGLWTPATHAGATTNVGVGTAMSALRKKVHLPLFLHVVHEAIGLTERPIPVSYSHSAETVQKSLVKHLQSYAKLRGLVLSAADQAWLDARLTGKHRVVPPCCTTWAGWHTIVSDITTIYAGVSFNPNQTTKGLPVLHRLGRADHIDYWHKLSTATAEARGMYTRGWQLIADE